MLIFDRDKEFERLFASNDIIGLEAFTEKNNYYQKIYKSFRGRFYFDTKNKFSLKISPDKKTAALICLLQEQKNFSSSSEYNLEILISQADACGNFHRTEHIRYDYYDKMRFAGLENNAVLLICADNPQQIMRRYFKKNHNYLGLPEIELFNISKTNACISRNDERKKALIQNRQFYRKQMLQAKNPQNALQAKLATWNEINLRAKI